MKRVLMEPISFNDGTKVGFQYINNICSNNLLRPCIVFC